MLGVVWAPKECANAYTDGLLDTRSYEFDGLCASAETDI